MTASSETPDRTLARAVRRHGGEAGKERMAQVRLRVAHLGGRIPRSKGLGRTHPQPGVITVEPFAARLTFHDYPEPGLTLVYERGTLVSGAERREHYRRTFRGLRKLRRWSPQDAAYFFGYALTDYLALPWSMGGVEIVGGGQTADRGLILDRIDAHHPKGADTHSRKQSYYFEPDGLLVRHDYRADVIGPVFTGAHYSDDYDESHGVPIATRRTVHARVGRRVLSTTVLEARFEVLAVASG